MIKSLSLGFCPFFLTALCELCGFIGEREAFYSKSKRFCRMECAKKFSACQKKNTNKGLVTKRAAAKKRTRVAAKQKRVCCQLDYEERYC